MRRGRWTAAFVGIALVATTGCEGLEPPLYWGFERMVLQSRYTAFQANPFFADERAMRPPPEGTVPWGGSPGPPAIEEGVVGGEPVDRVPIPLTRPLLERGRERFEIYCGACHGIMGDAGTPVAARMLLRPPPSLHDPRIRALPPGRLYRIVKEGYGLMPGYEDVLSVEERWGVVAYVQALQLSQGAGASGTETGAERGEAEGRSQEADVSTGMGEGVR